LKNVPRGADVVLIAPKRCQSMRVSAGDVVDNTGYPPDLQSE
jgi:hypothetical protein